MSYVTLLAELLPAECDDRARHRSERRIKAAPFPRQKPVGEFGFDANPNIFGGRTKTFTDPALHCRRRPAHLQRHEHRDRHRLLPTRSHPEQGRAANRYLTVAPAVLLPVIDILRT